MRSHKSSLLNSIRIVFIASALSFSSSAFAGSWQEHETHLAVMRQRVKDAESEIKELIKEKRNTQDEAEIKVIVEKMGIAQEAYEKASKTVEAEELHVRFKHPEHAEKANVMYTRHTKTLAELEDEIGIDGRLDRIKIKVLATFPITNQPVVVRNAPKISPLIRRPASIDGYSPDPDDTAEHIKLVK